MASAVDIALSVFFAIFVLVDIIFNGVLVLAIRRRRKLHTPMNLLILHLSITDILTGVFIIPRHILSYAITYPDSTASNYICMFVTGGNFIWTSATAASGFLTIIALERFFAVVHPHKARLRVTKARLKWLVWACWISSFAFNLPSLLVLEYNRKLHFCTENWPAWASPRAYVAVAFFAGNSSVIAMYILYSIILYSLWKKDKTVSEVSRSARINARKRVTRMLILMTVVHMICRTPNYTFYTLSYFDPDAQYGSTVYSFTVFLILLNSASHPFFFCWYMKNLRREVVKVSTSFRCPSRLRGMFHLFASETTSSASTARGDPRRQQRHSQSVEGALSSGLYSDTDDIYSTKTPTISPTPQLIEYKKDGESEKVEFAFSPVFNEHDDEHGNADHDLKTKDMIEHEDEENCDELKTDMIKEAEDNKTLEMEADVIDV